MLRSLLRRPGASPFGVALLIACGANAAGEPLRLLRVTPAGEDVPAERQIVFQFDRDVVPLGRMGRSAAQLPITIEPDPGCEWRWLDRSALACRLGEDDALLPSTRYSITVRPGPGITTAEGATLAGEVRHTFVTKRPALDNVWAENWTSPGTLVMRAVFNQEVDEASVARHLVFRPATGQPVAADVRRPEPEPEPDSIEGCDAAFEGATEPRPTLWMVRPASELPADTLVALRIEPGILPVHGNEPGIEDRDVVTFRTFPAPRVLGIRCFDLSENPVSWGPDNGGRQPHACDPQAGVRLVFASPVGEEVLRDHLQIDPPLRGEDPWGSIDRWSTLAQTRDIHEYEVPLPQPLAAFTEYRLRAPAGAIEDEFGRPLVTPIDLRFVTDHRKPELDVLHPVSVLESQVPTQLPIIVQNLHAVHARFERVTADGVLAGIERQLPIPPAQDVAYRFPLDIRAWLGSGSGAVVGTLTSTPHTGPAQWFISQVTPFHVHVKVGHYNTLVWVTDLATGDPVAGAEIDIVAGSWERFDPAAAPRARGETDGDGLAELPGSEVLDPSADLINYDDLRTTRHLTLRVRRGRDLAFVPLVQDFRVQERGPNESWIQVWRRPRHGHLRAWGVTAQGIYRAVDRVQYKVWVRNAGNETLFAAPPTGYALKVVDPLDKVVHERDGLTLDAFGGLDGEFTVPATGAVGWYRFELRPDFATGQVWQPLTVLVSDFTPAPFRVTTDLDGELVRAGGDVTVTTAATLHAGGPYVEAETRVTGLVRPAPFLPEDPVAQGYHFDVGDAETETIHRSDGVLDGRGERTTRFAVRAERVQFGELSVESAVRDDRGKYVASRATARYAGRDRYVGVRQGDWVLEAGKPAEFTAIVTDDRGRIVPDVPIRLTVERLVTRAARVKGAGNAYLTEYVHDWEAAGECTAASATEPVACAFTPEAAGEHRLTAAIEDTLGRPVASRVQRWAVGRDVVLWEEPPGHHLQIVPEKETLRVGETARYLIKNPFPGARALVTLERSGVIRRWLTTLEDSTPILEFLVEPELIPGFHLSVLVTAPRVERPPGDGDVDLGKPAFRLGYARADVRDPYKELAVTVRPAAEVLKPRQRAVIEIEAATRQGEVPPMQLAVAVLDESVLDLLLSGEAGFDPYLGMYEPEPLDVWNFNLLKNLVGLQAFGKKGATPGGDGGMDPALRSVFKFVSYWNPALATDAQGRARVEFEVPDNLTAWRVLVMAATAEDRFGLGQASFRVNRPTELRAALPNQVLEGDRFEARFTVMNRTDRPRKLVVSATARGAVRRPTKVKRVIEAEPFQRRTVAFEVEALEPGEVQFEVRAGDRVDTDALAARLSVRRGVALETAAEYGSTVGGEAVEQLSFPDPMRTDVGHVAVSAAPTVIGSLEGAFRYMRDYPYVCWEQILSRGVMAAHYGALRDWLPRDLDWPGADTLPQRTLDAAPDFQTPSGGFAYFQPADEYASPYLSAYTALAFQWLRAQGHEVPAGVEQKLYDYLGTLLRRDELPTFYSRSMASSVRAVALAALARAGKATLDDATRQRPHLQQMDLFGRAHYLQALAHLAGPESLRREALDSILAHAQESAGKIVFTESLDDGYQQILHSELRTSCAVLEALLAEGGATLAASGAAELPMKIVRSVTQTRGRGGHWENTQENLFCTGAIAAYARAYEQEAPSFTVAAALDGEKLGEARFEDRRAGAVRFERPLRPSDPGREAEIRLTREGRGRLYYRVALSWSPVELPTSPVDAGIELHREYAVQRDGAWIGLGDPAIVRSGELVRVDLFVVLPAARNFVVLDDPVPGGLEPVNRDLATASLVDADEAEDVFPPDSIYYRYDDWQTFAMTFWSFYHRELRHDAARFYSEYLPAGRYRLSYVAQVIAPGSFTIPPTHAEEMYDPDVFGNGVAGRLEVRDSP
jgi:uncharacterized protein YfaS (alpha-2-macroglobulin family)